MLEKITWAVDPVHSRIRFDAKYLQITSISGWFREFEGLIVTENENFANSIIQLTIYTNSLYTGNDFRDNHLRSPDFFDTKQYPVIDFRSSSVQVLGANLQVSGVLSVKDITQDYQFTARYLGAIEDPNGNTKAGFEMECVLNRKDFNISWNQLYGADAWLLSNEVTLHADIQLLKITHP